jgi:hypothetical protein
MKVPGKETISKLQKLKQETEAVLRSSQAANIHTEAQHLEVHTPRYLVVDCGLRSIRTMEDRLHNTVG